MRGFCGRLQTAFVKRVQAIHRHICGVAAAYFIVSMVWIAVTEGFVVADPKNWVFVIVTTLVLNWKLLRERRRRDATEQKLKESAFYDPLTGLLNRTAFAANLRKTVARARREAGRVGVIFVDLDRFKEVNDNHGHHIGDETLVEVADRLRAITRSADSMGRYGGDEFLVLVEGNSGGGTARVAQRIGEVLDEAASVQGIEITMKASVGFAVFPEDADDWEQLIQAADQAMYRVKASGRVAIQET